MDRDLGNHFLDLLLIAILGRFLSILKLCRPWLVGPELCVGFIAVRQVRFPRAWSVWNNSGRLGTARKSIATDILNRKLLTDDDSDSVATTSDKA